MAIHYPIPRHLNGTVKRLAGGRGNSMGNSPGYSRTLDPHGELPGKITRLEQPGEFTRPFTRVLIGSFPLSFIERFKGAAFTR